MKIKRTLDLFEGIRARIFIVRLSLALGFSGVVSCGSETRFSENTGPQEVLTEPELKEETQNSSNAVAKREDIEVEKKPPETLKEDAVETDTIIPAEQIKEQPIQPVEEILAIDFTQLHSIGNELDYSPVDIVFVVDSSGSMNQEQKKLENLMGDFLKQLADSPLPLDFQVYVVGDRFQFPAPVYEDARFELVNVGVRSFDALDKAARFLNGEFALKLPARPGAYKELIIISDDDARKVTSENFFELTSKESVILHGLVGFNKGQDPKLAWCNIMNVGSSYKDLAESTKGILHNLCDESWSPLFERLVQRMIQRLATNKVALSYKPVNPEEIKVRFKGFANDIPIKYLKTENSIVFTGKSAPIPGVPIEIHYTYNPE